MTNADKPYWTIAYRKPRANRFARVTDFAGDWHEAQDLARKVGLARPDLEVWTTTTAEAERVGYTHGVDVGNILTDSNKRVRVTDTGSLADLGMDAADVTGDESRVQFGYAPKHVQIPAQGMVF